MPIVPRPSRDTSRLPRYTCFIVNLPQLGSSAVAHQDLTTSATGSTAWTAAADSPAYMGMALIWPVAVAPGGSPWPLGGEMRSPPTVASPTVSPARSPKASMQDRRTRARGSVAHSGQTEKAPVISAEAAVAPATACL